MVRKVKWDPVASRESKETLDQVDLVVDRGFKVSLGRWDRKEHREHREYKAVLDPRDLKVFREVQGRLEFKGFKAALGQ